MTTASAMTWPFEGRDGDVAALSAALAAPDCSGTIITGAAGVGKSTLAGHVVSVSSAMRHAGTITATAALRAVPYGAAVSLLPADLIADPDELDAERIGDALRSHLARGDRRSVVIIDDLPVLDTASWALIEEVIAEQRVHVIATARSDMSPPPVAIDGPGLRRHALGPLDRPSVERVLVAALGGHVETTAVESLWQASAGNPLFLRELVVDALQRDALRRTATGVWQLEIGHDRGDRLHDLVMERFHLLDPEMLAMMQLLAVAGGLHRADLDVDDRVVDGLVGAGLLVLDPGGDPVLRLAHPLHAELLQQSLGVFERRRIVGRAIELVSARPERRDADAMLIANLQLDAGLTPDLDAVIAGARRAHAAQDHSSTVRLARVALDATGSTEMRWMLVEALMHSGRSDEAEAVAAALDDGQRDASDPHESSLLGARIYNLLWYRKDPDAARGVLDRFRSSAHSESARDGLVIHEAYIRSFEGDAAGSLELLEQHRPWSPAVEVRGLTALSQALSIAGRGVDALEAADAAARAAARDAGPAGSVPPLVSVARARALIVVGDFAAAEDTLTDALGDVSARTSGFVRAATTIALGDVQLLRGRPSAARRWFGEAMLAAESATNPTLHAIAIGSLACATGQTNDQVASAALLADLNAIELPSSIGADELARGRAWATVAMGHPGGATGILRREAGASHLRGEHWDALWMLTEAARLGAAAEVRYETAALARGMNGATPAALAQFVHAMAARTVEALTLAEDLLVAIGADLMAAEAAGALVAAHRRDLDRRGADAAMERARQHAARCDGADTPALVAFDAFVPLSNRERQIAMLAARGLSNQEIASRLGVSPRTVGNHLQSVYTKLGISGRDALADHLDS